MGTVARYEYANGQTVYRWQFTLPSGKVVRSDYDFTTRRDAWDSLLAFMAA